jgi:hypothetical protein
VLLLLSCSSVPHPFPYVPIRSRGFSLTFPPQTFSPFFPNPCPKNITGGYFSFSSSSLQSLRLVVFDDSRNFFWFYFFFAFVASTNENEVAMNLAQFFALLFLFYIFFGSFFS